MPFHVISKNFGPHTHGGLRHKVTISENSALYLTNTLRTFSLALTGIFLPIYIFNLSKEALIFSDDPLKNGLYWILAYFFVRSLGFLVFIFTATKYIFSKLTLRRSVFLSFFASIIEIALLVRTESNLYIVFAAGLVGAIAICLYWVPYHIFFIRKFGGDGKHYGKEMGVRFFLVRLFSGIAPFIGGLLIANFGFKLLFYVVIILLGVSGLPILLTMSEHKHGEHNPFKILKAHLFNKRFRNFTLSMLGTSFDDLIYVAFWSLLMYLSLENFTMLGSVKSISLVISSVSVLWIGSKIDNAKMGRSIHKFGVIVNSLLYVPRIIFSSATLFYVIDAVDRLNGNFFTLPRATKVYEEAKKFGESDLIIYREIIIHSGFLVAILLSALVLISFSSWKIVFVLAALGSLLSYVIQFDD